MTFEGILDYMGPGFIFDGQRAGHWKTNNGKCIFGSPLEEATHFGVSLLVILCEHAFGRSGKVYYKVDLDAVSGLCQMLSENYPG